MRTISMHKLGLKLWSDNECYANEILRLRNKKCFDYIELYAMPDTYDRFADFWSGIGGPFVIHAPHFGHGVNLSNKESEKQNRKYINEACRFADKLDASMIIVHPGVGGTIEETISQLLTYKDTRIIIENKPYFGFKKEQICVGSRPEDLKTIIDSAGLRFCLDIGHAIYAANALSIDHIFQLREFLKLKPAIFHFTDGDINGLHDVHLRYGEGSFPLADFLVLIPDDSMLTNEAGKKSKTDLNDFETDAENFHSISKKDVSILSIRSASMEDAKSLYNLSMDPDVRKASLNSQSFSYESHVKWLGDNLKDPKKHYFICQVAGEFAGQIRYSFEKDSAIISLSFTKDWRGIGIANRFFSLSLNELTFSNPEIKRIYATVKIENVASNKFFQKLGFKVNNSIDSEKNVGYSLELQP